MGFWLFMTAMVLLIPAVMLCFGALFYRRAPKRINPVFGYRTAMSMKNRETWEFAHKYCGRLWIIAGIATFIPSLVLMLLVLPASGAGEGAVSICGMTITCVQCVVLVATIFPVESALKRRFDGEGKKKNSLPPDNQSFPQCPPG